jgi:thiamine-monophosphate kinase
VSLALAGWTTPAYVKDFYRGLRQLGDRFDVRIIGGDITQAQQFACDIVVIGGVGEGQSLRRHTARPGDRICVTGMLGGAALGLESEKGAAWRRHLRPEPRVKEGAVLRRQWGATSCMDLSDGLALDLHRLCVASGVAADLDWRLPLFPGAALRHAVLGGEDYELLFTMPADKPVPEEIEGTMVTPIGRIVEGKPGVMHFARKPLAAEGWDPFRKNGGAKAGRKLRAG